MNRPHRSAMLRLAAVAIIAGAVPAAAQNTTTFNLAGGLSLPTSDFSNRAEAGYTLIAGIGVVQRGSPVSGRLEGIYTEYDQKYRSGKAKAGGVTANAQYDFSSNSRSNLLPYMIGGIGLYSTREDRFGPDSETNIGWNLGGGLRIPLTGFSAYFEARYHRVSDVNVSFVPIVVGLRF